MLQLIKFANLAYMALLGFSYWSNLILGMQIFLVIAMIIMGILLIGLIRLMYKLVRPRAPDDRSNFSKFSLYEGKQLIFSITGKLNIMAVSLTDTQKASGVLTFKDKKLAVTDVPDGAVTLESTDENVFTASYEDASNTVTVVAGQPGVAALKIKATNKAGEDIPFEDIAVEVKSGDASTGGIDFSEPVEQ